MLYFFEIVEEKGSSFRSVFGMISLYAFDYTEYYFQKHRFRHLVFPVLTAYMGSTPEYLAHV